MLGAGTALLGKEAAMACTVAVEAVISEHYNKWEEFNYVESSFFNFWNFSQLRDLMAHADQVKDKDLIQVT